MDRLDEIKEREAKATPGPWVQTKADHPYRRTLFQDHKAGKNYLSDDIEEIDDAEFIAHAREDIPWLIAALEEERRTVERLRGLMADAQWEGERGNGLCPWCFCDRTEDRIHDDCPAFTPTGEVK